MEISDFNLKNHIQQTVFLRCAPEIDKRGYILSISFILILVLHSMLISQV
jgi:hypothetical protein